MTRPFLLPDEDRLPDSASLLATGGPSEGDFAPASHTSTVENEGWKRLETVLAQTGDAALQASAKVSDATQAEEITRVLQFLMANGWRPKADSFYDRPFPVLEKLASLVTDVEVKQCILVTALAESRSVEEAADIRTQLKELEASRSL